MKNLAPAATPGFAFHATQVNAATPAAPETTAGNPLHLVDMPCINTPAANKARTVSAAY